MKNSRAIVFPLLAVLLAAGVWFFQNQGGTPQIGDSNTGLSLSKDEPDGEVRADPTEPREVVATAVAERREDVSESSDESAAYTAALGGLRGRIVREKGKEPIPGVEVLGIELRVDVVLPTIEQAMEFIDGPNPVKFRVKTRTDGEGRFVLRGLHPRAIHLLGIGLKTTDASVRFVDHTPDRGETVDLGDIVIETRGSLRGVVQDSQGKPVAGARVRGLDIPQIAFQAGIGDFRPDGCAFVMFNETSFVVAPPPWIAELDRLLPFAETTTDATGAFDLDGVRPGMVTVLVQAPGKVPLTRATRVQPEQERNVGTLRLARPATLQLSFVDTNDQPVTTARAAAGRLLAMTPVGLTEAPEGVSADGTVKLSGLTRGKLYAIWQREDGAPWNVVGPLHDGDTKKIVVPAAAVGRVTVVSDKGEPVTKGVELAATFALGGVSEDIPIPGFLPKVRRDRIRPVTGEPGVWTIEGLVPGTWNLRARAEGFSFGGAQMIVKEGVVPEAKITLAPSTHASFLVVDSGGAPIQGARVYWNARRGMPANMRERMPRSPIPFMLGKTDAKGMLVADGVPVGATRFAFRHPAFAVAEVREQPVRADVPIR
ncbi:MAG: carboxypeptidase regulatory-like domain-containing protein, partial [Planctomycetes bacterium]|nr:carboxypeptidase regulatory-like domain-containing protein [Planctomycetota bacterium]